MFLLSLYPGHLFAIFYPESLSFQTPLIGKMDRVGQNGIDATFLLSL